MTIIRIILNAWAVLSIFVGLICAGLGYPIWALFPMLCAAACAYSSSVIHEFQE
jgi:hypothetical protein